ncbi:MAG: nucleotidyltransferase domain-containing protein, partial [Candidatus Dojkabacteria bacterium]
MARKEIPRVVLEQIKSYLDALSSSGVKFSDIYLYGSFAKGHFNEWSDIDLCVV